MKRTMASCFVGMHTEKAAGDMLEGDGFTLCTKLPGSGKKVSS